MFLSYLIWYFRVQLTLYRKFIEQTTCCIKSCFEVQEAWHYKLTQLNLVKATRWLDLVKLSQQIFFNSVFKEFKELQVSDR